MARPLRIQFTGARYHVMSRGDRREPIFQDDADRVEFLRSLGQACQKTGWQVHAYCLMSNHFHLLLETPQPKGHHVKVKIAQQLREQTPMHRQWIADRLRMGSASYVSNLLGSVDSKL